MDGNELKRRSMKFACLERRFNGEKLILIFLIDGETRLRGGNEKYALFETIAANKSYDV